MFHGQPYCGSCDFQGPDFMWMWHHVWGFGVLVQDRESFALRVIPVPDHEVFYSRDGKTRAQSEEESEAYVAEVVARELQRAERRVSPSEFIDFGSDDEDPKTTQLPCPVCRALLLWRHTGIS